MGRGVAQMVAHMHGVHGVAGSSPVTPTQDIYECKKPHGESGRGCKRSSVSRHRNDFK